MAQFLGSCNLFCIILFIIRDNAHILLYKYNESLSILSCPDGASPIKFSITSKAEDRPYLIMITST